VIRGKITYAMDNGFFQFICEKSGRKPKRPTLAKTAPGWGTLKFRYAARSLATAGSLLPTSETPVDFYRA
jgi:hypothetical protein